jgi:two-component system, chemotaxis family, chemotaxis protein CheY
VAVGYATRRANVKGRRWMQMAKALIVDDSRTIRTILKRILLELGYEVCEAADGTEALAAIDAEGTSVSLILTDWNMAEMDGLDLLEQLRQNPELSLLKIITVTTETELGRMVSALDAGANEYVMKPFTKDIVREKLELSGIRSEVME